MFQLLLLLLVADTLAMAGMPPGLRFVAALVLFAFLPGWSWLQALFENSSQPGERLVLVVGLSLALTISGTMLATYWPGPLRLSHLLLMSNVITIAGLISWRRNSSASSSPLSSSTAWLVLTGLLLLAALLRLPRLGYAEFHEDEAEALMLGVRLLQGEDYALFLHRKGPAQMLLPVAFWLTSDQITEYLARFPFALSSILSVLGLFFIGRRWFSQPAGIISGLLWAMNGYAIAFGRMVQYQALIFFMAPLGLYCLYLAWFQRQVRFLFPAALLLAVSLLAHFDALLLLPAAIYLSWLILKGEPKGQLDEASTAPSSSRARFLAAGLALFLFLGLLASFYLPYILDPEFQNTATYLSESRVQPGLFYNNTGLLRRFDQDYSSRFYLPMLTLGILIFILVANVPGKRPLTQQDREHRASLLGKERFDQVLVIILLGFIGSTIAMPELWQVGPLSLALIPWLGLGFLCFWRASRVETRAAWLMLGGPLIGYLFLVNDPRTHLYILYPGAVLLAGAGWGKVWEILKSRPGAPLARFASVGLLVGGLLVSGLIVTYLYSIFLQTESAFGRLRNRWDDSIWEIVYNEIPRPREYFGYPKQEGWKAVGALRLQGHFPRDFRSVNEDFVIPIWYNFGQPRSCYDTPAYFFVRTAGFEGTIPAELYGQAGQVKREDEIRLQIYRAGADIGGAVETYVLEEYIDVFDEAATVQRFTNQNRPAQPVETHFGPQILFEGYDLITPVVAPGDILYLDLYWQALDSPKQDYRAFVHLTDGTTLWGQQDDTPACRLPTSLWRPSQHSVGQFRLPIKPETPPGRYPLIIGLYQAETLERLKITAGAGQVGDDFLWLGDIEVKKP